MPRSHPSRPSIVAAGLAAVALVASAACGGDGDVSRDTFRSDLEERTTIPAPVAGCITDGVFEEYGQEDVNEIYGADDEEELGEERLATLNEINQRCFEEEGSESEPESDSEAEPDPEDELDPDDEAPGPTSTTEAG